MAMNSLSATIMSFPWRGLALSFWRLTSVKIALVLALVGLGFWVSEERHPQVDDFSSSLGKPKTHLSPSSPASFRLGVSYIGGVVIGWCFRKFIRFTTLLAAAVLGGIALLKTTGLIELDWASVESHVRESLAWMNGQAAALKTFLTGYLPSAGAGGWGLVKGLRHRDLLPE